MDYQGQKLAELAYYWIIIIFGGIGWLWGFYEKNFMYTFNAWAVGVVISVVLCVPDWPWFNRNPVVWWNGQTRKSSSTKESGSSKATKSKVKNKAK
mmetsp:Transcript_63588/g.143444  ORF Transcript_63588/g.143444 Transcript_63588/m.143444 type:complete len:96 (+) Transcript_63588:119-406(+)